MSSVLELIDAICEAYDDGYFKSRDINGDGIKETFCNFAVRSVAVAIGYLAFDQKALANEMIDFMAASPNWIVLPMEKAQEAANHGEFVIAAQKAAGHGHICVVRPGVEGYSNKWQCKVPKVMNVGKDNFISRGVNFAFQTIPQFYMLQKQT